jgi:anthranilate/para-aminobenzoate synthase component I
VLSEGHAAVGAVESGLSEGEYAEKRARARDLIAAGDIYQAKLTHNAAVSVGGEPLLLCNGLRAGARAPFGALVFIGS